jgi:hypothetical protein
MEESMIKQLKQAPDLRRALDRLPKPDGIPEIRVTIDVAENDPGQRADDVRMVPMTVDFHRGMLTTPGGAEPVWVYEGTLAIDGVTSAGHAPAQVAEWLREQLGPRCLAVEVSDVAPHEATVRIAATSNRVERPD